VRKKGMLKLTESKKGGNIKARGREGVGTKRRWREMWLRGK
jgi:hypothetical protein